MKIKDECIVLNGEDPELLLFVREHHDKGVITFDLVERPDKSDPTNYKLILVPRHG